MPMSSSHASGLTQNSTLNSAQNSTLESTRTSKQPELLVSAQSIQEVETLAAIEGVDIIDLKDPSWGALSPTSVDLWKQVAAKMFRVNARQSLSAALGEFEQADRCVEHLPPEFDFAKMGPAECEDPALLQRRWNSIRNRLHPSTELVAVAYADFASARSISPADVLRSAIESGLNRILIDTCFKNGQTSIGHLGIPNLREFADTARTSGVWWSLAGSIDLAQANQLLAAGVIPNCIGVRGAVCEDGRSTALSKSKCEDFCRVLT